MTRKKRRDWNKSSLVSKEEGMPGGGNSVTFFIAKAKSTLTSQRPAPAWWTTIHYVAELISAERGVGWGRIENIRDHPLIFQHPAQQTRRLDLSSLASAVWTANSSTRINRLVWAVATLVTVIAFPGRNDAWEFVFFDTVPIYWTDQLCTFYMWNHYLLW